jgi:fucose permease
MQKSSIRHPGLLAANCLITLHHGLVMLFIGPMLPEIMDTFGIGEAQAGLLLGAGALGYALGPIVGGVLLDRHKLKLLMVLCFGLETGFLIAFGLTPLFFLTVVFNFGLVFMGGQLETAANYLPNIVGARSVSSVMNLVHFFFSVGALIGPILIGSMLNRGGHWRNFLFYLAVPTFGLAVYSLFLKVPAENPGKKTEAPPASKKRFFLFDFFRSARHPAVVFGALALVFYVGAELGFASWLVNYLEKEHFFPKLSASLALSLFWIGLVAGRLINTIIARTVSSKIIIAVSSVTGLISGALFLVVSKPVFIFPAAVLIGLAMSGIFPIVMAEVTRHFPKEIGKVTGVMTFGAGVGGTLFQWLIGVTAEYAGLRASMAFTPALFVLSGICFWITLKCIRKLGPSLYNQTWT